MLLFFQETRPGQNQERLFRGEIVSCVQRRDCALLRAKTSALLRRKTCAVLRARTCALLRANTKGGGLRPPPFVVSFVGVGFCVLWAVGLHICVVGAFLDTIALQAEPSRAEARIPPSYTHGISWGT